jgi:hypothetical protein
MSVLGKFGVIMADPPWEIHQDLPYGTMADVEMRQMKIGDLQDDGVIFLWVTGSIPAPMWHAVIVKKGVVPFNAVTITKALHLFVILLSLFSKC